MKFYSVFLVLALFSFSALAEVQCEVQARSKAAKMGVEQGLTMGLGYVDTEVESHSYAAKKVSMRIKASFTSSEEHEFIRIDMELDAVTCKILKTAIVQDSRH